MRYLYNISSFLKRHKTTVHELLVFLTSLGSCIAALFSWKASVVANEISEKQLQIQLVDKQPLFKVSYECVKDSSDTEFRTQVYTIENIGKPYKKVSIKNATFWVLSYHSPKGTKILNIPISDYFNATFSGSNSGDIESGFALLNYYYYLQFEKECMSKSKDNRFYFIDKKSFFQIDYTDILGQNQQVTFVNEQECSSEYFNQTIQDSKKHFGEKIFNISRISLDDIIPYFYKNDSFD